MTTDFLISAINEFEDGGFGNPDFLKKAHSIYNEYATFPSPLTNAENPYLLGILFSHFAKYYQKNVDYNISILENALFCFSRVIKNTDTSSSEHQCAAIRMLLLIDDNECAMKGIAKSFFEKKCQELYGTPLMVQKILAQGMDAWTFEIDILKNLGYFCTEQVSSENKHSFISASEMKHFVTLEQSRKYFTEWPLVEVPKERVFELFFEFISECINTPYEHRISSVF